MFECPFIVGQKVVAIYGSKWSLMPGTAPNSSWRDAWAFFWARKPSKGRIYTIDAMGCDFGVIWLKFKELDDRRYDARSFRPLIARKTDISVFETILADVNAGKVKPVTEPV